MDTSILDNRRKNIEALYAEYLCDNSIEPRKLTSQSFQRRVREIYDEAETGKLRDKFKDVNKNPILRNTSALPKGYEDSFKEQRTKSEFQNKMIKDVEATVSMMDSHKELGKYDDAPVGYVIYCTLALMEEANKLKSESLYQDDDFDNAVWDKFFAYYDSWDNFDNEASEKFSDFIFDNPEDETRCRVITSIYRGVKKGKIPEGYILGVIGFVYSCAKENPFMWDMKVVEASEDVDDIFAALNSDATETNTESSSLFESALAYAVENDQMDEEEGETWEDEIKEKGFAVLPGILRLDYLHKNTITKYIRDDKGYDHYDNGKTLTTFFLVLTIIFAAIGGAAIYFNWTLTGGIYKGVLGVIVGIIVILFIAKIGNAGGGGCGTVMVCCVLVAICGTVFMYAKDFLDKWINMSQWICYGLPLFLAAISFICLVFSAKAKIKYRWAKNIDPEANLEDLGRELEILVKCETYAKVCMDVFLIKDRWLEKQAKNLKNFRTETEEQIKK